MKGRLSKKKILLLALLLIAGTLFCVFAILRNHVKDPSRFLGVLPEESGVCVVNGGTYYVNRLDGYVLPIEESAEVDGSRMEVGTEIRTGGRSVQVFVQDVSAGSGVDTLEYLYYSKRFLESNPVDHEKLSQNLTVWNGFQTLVTEWKRPLLSRVPDDHNCYTCIDIVNEGKVYTFLIKTDKQLEKPLDAVEGLLFCDVTETISEDVLRIEPTTWPKNEETASLYEAMFGENASFTWGFYSEDVPVSFRELNDIEKRLGHRWDFLMVYSDFQPRNDRTILAEPVQKAMDEGRIFLISLQTGQLADGSSQLYDILDGQYDGFLADYAQAIAGLDGPVLFRIGNEMNGDWCTYSALQASMDASLYRAFYAYVQSFFEKAGADNVIWVWNPNETSYPNFRWNSFLAYYPDGGCDVYGVTGYNTGTYYEGEVWREFSAIYDPLMEDAERRSDVPCMITEFGCAEMGGDKEAWLTAMFEQIGTYPLLKAAVWWNNEDWDYAKGVKAREYRIDHNDTYLGLFRKYIFGK